LRVKLAGFNIDADILRQLERRGHRHLTPETLSAAYARISRSPLPIDQLRKKACLDVEKSRSSNQKIIFEMGHHSVAEHAVFNFDIMGVSRLALEEIEKFRLVSYTEKSQRYVTLEGELVFPKEIRDAAHKKLFRETAQKQNRFYFKAFALLNKRLQRPHRKITNSSAGQKLVEGWAKEDARYILPLASSGQVGMTINARNLEHMFRRLRLSSRTEVRELAEKLYALVLPIAPSIILFPEPTAFDREAFSGLDEYFAHQTEPAGMPPGREPEIVSCSENGDDLILAAHASVSRGLDFSRALVLVKKATPARKKALLLEFFRKIQFFSAMPREFEMADITFQAVVSAANFAQLKRHRMATLLAGDYAPELGNTCPASIRDAGLKNEFSEIIESTNHAYHEIKKKSGGAADYVLTNSHCRTILMKMNLREMYHFARLRDDEHAQWDIRALAHALSEKVRTFMPLTAMMLCGKSAFNEEYEKIFKTPPLSEIKN
jgi:flavin-dependent thymidylate synthase